MVLVVFLYVHHGDDHFALIVLLFETAHNLIAYSQDENMHPITCHNAYKCTIHTISAQQSYPLTTTPHTNHTHSLRISTLKRYTRACPLYEGANGRWTSPCVRCNAAIGRDPSMLCCVERGLLVCGVCEVVSLLGGGFIGLLYGYIHTHTFAHIFTHIYSHVYIHTHIYTHIYIHTYSQPTNPFSLNKHRAWQQ